MRRCTRISVFVLILGSLSLAGALAARQLGAQAAGSPSPLQAQATPTTTATANAYVNPAVCATCHAGIARTYALTGMGRSFAPVTAAGLPVKLPAKPYFHAPSQTYYTVLAKGGKLYERQWQSGYHGKPTNVSEIRIDYVLGSGHHAMAFLHLTAQHTLEELPFGWYAENGGTWAMQPGYDRPDNAGTSRLIGDECMFCHNAYPANAATARLGTEPIYPLPLPHGIDCQRCHGPGRLHVETVEHGGTLRQIRASIVNPARLGPTREMEVCMQCHLETTSLRLPHAILRVGRLPFSYIPGQPLGDYELAFDRAPGQNTRFEIDSAAYRLRQSQCFIQTQSWAPSRRLQCTTCHDPHNIPHGPTADAHYNAICQSCHSAAAVLAKAPDHPRREGRAGAPGVPGPAERQAGGVAKPRQAPRQEIATNCIACHMPKRRTADGIHIVMTDHLIQSRPPANLLAPRSEYVETSANAYKGPVELYYPAKLPPSPKNQLALAVAQVRDDSDLKAGIAQLTALIAKDKPPQADDYTDLAAALHDAGEEAKSNAMYREALRHAPNSPAILLRWGQAQLNWRRWSAAETTLRRVTGLTPNDPAAWVALGEAQFQQSKDAAATRSLTRALALDPNTAEADNYLGLIRARAGDTAGAEAAFRQALAAAPNLAPAQANLASLLASENRLPEASFLFRRALKLDPTFGAAHLNYGRLFAAEGNGDAALAQARSAVSDEANSADAHEFLGYLLTLKGNGAEAIQQLSTAVRLNPNFWRAHLELGVAYSLTGDTAGWRRELEIAAHGTDAAVRATALQMLQTAP